MKKMINYLPTFILCGFIFVMMILLFFLPKSDFSVQEKRQLSDFPEVTAETVFSAKFQNELDTYLSDHIPGRNFFVGMSAGLELAEGRNGSKGIYLGSGGYLFPKPSQKTENLMKNAGYIKEFAAESDIPVYMTVIPSSGYINGSKLPPVHEPYQDGELINDFQSALGSDVKFCNVNADFLMAADSEQLYYRTDHHWTSTGAYEAYTLLGKTMDFKPLPEDSFSKEKIKGFYGTSYSKSALWMLEPDTITLWSNKNQPQGSLLVEISDGQDKKTSTEYFFLDQLKNDDKYPVFLDGNHSLVRITNNNVKSGTLILIKDSYAHTIAPFLSQNYREIIMVDMRYYKKEISALAKQEAADSILILYSLDNLSADNNLAYLF